MNKIQEIIKWYKLTIESQGLTLKILNSSPEIVLFNTFISLSGLSSKLSQ